VTFFQIFWMICGMVLCIIRSLLACSWSAILLMGLIPVVSASPNHEALSNITFQTFAEFIEENFSSTVSLATVLVTLFTISDNSDLLNLHSRMQHPKMGERGQTITAWIKALACALKEKLGENNTKRLFKRSEEMSDLDNEQLNQGLAVKLDALYQLLDISPYNDQDERQPIYKGSKEDFTLSHGFGRTPSGVQQESFRSPPGVHPNLTGFTGSTLLN
jgi:hypothetical protein